MEALSRLLWWTGLSSELTGKEKDQELSVLMLKTLEGDPKEMWSVRRKFLLVYHSQSHPTRKSEPNEMELGWNLRFSP